MNEESVETIRATKRDFLVLNRRKCRDEASDINRSMQNFNINTDTVLAIAKKLKTKSSVTVSELQTLKNALIEDGSHIQVVLNTYGALRGLVREMTGHEVNKQCAAVGCCCNLALGDSRAGVTLVKAAGPYLVTALDSLTIELAVTSAWTLGNLAGSGVRSCELLTAQGAVAKLVELLGSNNEEMRDAALYALTHFSYQMKDELRTEHLHKICRVLHSLDINAILEFLFILSCHKDFTSDLIAKELLLKLIEQLVLQIQQCSDNNVTYIIRFLANVISREVYIIVLNSLLQNNMAFDMKKLCESNESVLWFLGNAFKLCDDHVFFQMLFNL